AGYLTDYLAEISAFAGSMRRAAFVPFAAVTRSWEEFAAMVANATGFALDVVRGPDDLAHAGLIIVGGGNTFQLLRECRARGLLGAMRERVKARTKYLGWSAGANLACPTIKTTNDMPIVDPGGLEALGLVRFQINAHYTPAVLPNHFGESRDERLAEFARANPGVPVIGLPEGDWLRVSGGLVELRGPHAAAWFEAGKLPARVMPGKVPT
ncbi:MAG: dipeptidase PepE, partial [Burkholderiales bacterium]